MRLHHLIPFACAAALAGCASAPARAPAAAAAARSDVIELNGRLSVSYTSRGEPQSLSGSFNWLQAGQRVDVTLSSPLGQTIARIAVTPEGATLSRANEPPRSAADIDTLTAQALGWPLPVSGLRDWLQGQAVAADGSRFVATPARNSVTTRDGWRLRFVSWQDDAAPQPQPQPRRIDAERPPTLQSDALSIRIVIDPKA